MRCALLRALSLTPAFGQAACSPERFEKPAYAPEAIRQRISGTVEARLVIGPDGSIKTNALTGHSLLTVAVAAALQKTRIEPACGGLEYRLTYRFAYEPIYLPDTGRRPPLPAKQFVEFKAPDQFVIRYQIEPVVFQQN